MPSEPVDAAAAPGPEPHRLRCVRCGSGEDIIAFAAASDSVPARAWCFACWGRVFCPEYTP